MAFVMTILGAICRLKTKKRVRQSNNNHKITPIRRNYTTFRHRFTGIEINHPDLGLTFRKIRKFQRNEGYLLSQSRNLLVGEKKVPPAKVRRGHLLIVLFKNTKRIPLSPFGPNGLPEPAAVPGGWRPAGEAAHPPHWPASHRG